MTVMSHKAPAQAPRVSRAAVAKWRPLAVLLCGPFVYVLDFFIINVAMPGIQQGLHASAADIEWIVAGYALTSGSLLITGGRLGDHYGRRRMFALGITAFAATSALCALATSPGFLISARLAQGTAAAIMAPNVLSIVGVTYSGRDRIRAITAYGLVMGLAAAGGQVIGGLLISANVLGLGWRAIFWVNVPVGLVAAVLAQRIVPESRSGHEAGGREAGGREAGGREAGGREAGAGRRRLDLTGVALLTAALVAIVLPLATGRQQGWPAWSWACLGAGPVLLVGFAGWLRRTRRRGGQPLLDPAIFAAPALRSGLTVQVLFWCQQAAGYLMIALYLQQGRGLSPVESGGAFSVLALGYLVTSLRAPALTMRFGRSVIMTGALCGCLGDGLLLLAVWHWGTGGPLLALFPGLLLLGAGQGLCITPLTTTVLSHAGPQTAGSVSGALSTAQQVGNAIGVAITGVVFYGLLPRGYRAAFGSSVAEMGLLLLSVAALALIIPRPRPLAGGEG